MRRIAARAIRTCQGTVRSHRGLSSSHLHGPVRASRKAAFPQSSSLGQSTHSPNPNTSPVTYHNTYHNHNNTLRLSSSSSSPSPRPRPDGLKDSSQSLMNVRRATAAVVSGLVGYGAWYTYNGNSTDTAQALSNRAFSSSTSPENAIPTRSVLVIGTEELQTATFVGEGPITKTTDDDGRTVVEMLNADQSTQKLRKMEESYHVNRGRGVLRYDQAQLPSNSPIEDDHAEKIVEIPARPDTGTGSDWMFWGVFDGHSGWTTSAKLRQTLISYVARELNETYKAGGASTPPEAVDAAIIKGFTKLDDEIVHQSVQEVFKSNSRNLAAELLAPALSGSCALLSFYDSSTGLLRVACTGDSRAVLGRRSNNGKWSATPLSVDQTGANQDEANRMRKLHPGEEHVVRNGRVLGGLEPTRAFGDATYKWSKDVASRLRESFFGRSQSPLMKTPPYVTAEPVVTTTKVHPERGDFLVLATDGLWEMLTNEEVVGLVGKWIETHTSKGSNSQLDSVWSKIFGGSKGSDLPVEHGTETVGKDGQKTPIRVRQWGISADDDRFVVKDNNVATHLIRNALGGKNEEMVSALLTLPSPYSRRYRDDLTVQVIFFGNGEKAQHKNQEIVVNDEATAPPRSKL